GHGDVHEWLSGAWFSPYEIREIESRNL
ncbi:MAG: hypothetical protein QOF15_3990, partial [Mycobacterium sp.]|nr:hypothetical protein [Mycobacterium sp.]